MSDALREAASGLAVRFRRTRPLAVGGRTLSLFRVEAMGPEAPAIPSLSIVRRRAR